MSINKKWFVFSFLIFLFLFFITNLSLFFYWNSPTPFLKNQKVPYPFSVYEGEFGYAVIKRLKAENLIKSPLGFKILLKFSKEPLKQGAYHIPPQSDSKRILKILQSGKSVMIFLTIPEGKTLKGVAQIVEEKGFCSATDFLTEAKKHPVYKWCSRKASSCEGFLFPDSYLVPYNADPKELLDIFYSRFEKIIESYPKEKVKDSDYLYQKLILASIVEKEYKRKEEAPLIASVFQNRLNVGMKLESCATVVYIIGDLLGKKHPKRLYYVDLEIENPYNTYKIKGLPPAPICSPGKVALDAVLNPIKSDYFYFVVKDPKEGSHHFSSKYKDHEKYQKDYVDHYLH